jgi:hypothetical protein
VAVLPSVFISYSSKDVKIAEAMESYLHQNGFDNVWRDKSNIRSHWSKEIANALSKSDIVLSYGQKINLSQIASDSED